MSTLVIACVVCLLAGFCTAAIFNANSYDDGFNAGWAEAKRDDLFRELEEEDGRYD